MISAQLSHAKKQVPIILEYMQGSSNSNNFLPIYQKFAEEHPELSFYKINTDEINDEVKDNCLGYSSHLAFQ